MYENEVEKPMVPKAPMMEKGMGCHEFKGQAMDIAYGQAGKKGCESDYKKLSAQAFPTMPDSANDSGY